MTDVLSPRLASFSMSSDVIAPAQEVSRLLLLPSELRDIVYEHLFDRSGICFPIPGHEGYHQYDFSTYLALQLTCRTVSAESKRVFFQQNRFVRVATPWPEAQHHIEHEGRVPMVAISDKVSSFKNWSIDAVIDAPQLRGLGIGAGSLEDLEFCKFIMHAKDVEAFTKMWFYSDLSHLGLNGHLRLTLVLRDPFPSVDKETGEKQERQLPVQLQREIMMPFGRVKGLQGVEVHGDYENDIFLAMKAEMDVPYTTAEECLERASKKREEADQAIAKKEYIRALKIYWQSFEELHIPCEGRRRNIYGDAWFVKTLDSGRYEGQQGHLVRLVMRVQLVAAVVQCYLALQLWEEAKFWGMRSINLMREANGDEDGETEDEPMLGFPGADAVGWLYFRTGLAWKMTGDFNEARKLVKVAVSYLPTNSEIKSEWAELQLKKMKVGGYGWM